MQFAAGEGVHTTQHLRRCLAVRLSNPCSPRMTAVLINSPLSHRMPTPLWMVRVAHGLGGKLRKPRVRLRSVLLDASSAATSTWRDQRRGRHSSRYNGAWLPSVRFDFYRSAPSVCLGTK